MLSGISLAMLVTGIFSSCKKNNIEAIKLISSTEDLPSESSTNVEIIFSDSARITLRLIAPKLNRYDNEDDPYTEFPEGLKLVFYNSLQKPESQIECKYAINHEKDKIMEAKDDVVVINEKGEKLNTEHLIWDQPKGLIHTEEFVKITTEEKIFFGDGLEANEDFSKYKIKNSKGTILINDNDLTEGEDEDVQ